MKNFIQIIGIIIIAIVCFSACKKEKAEQNKEDQFSVSTKLVMGKSTENAIIIGTKTALKVALEKKEGPVYLRKVAKANNVFIPIVGEGPDPFDPSRPCREEIGAYYSEHIAEWQQAANSSCTPIIMCLTCPKAAGGLYVTYIIRPNNPRCTIATAFEDQFNLFAFNFGNDQLENEAVAAHIKNK